MILRVLHVLHGFHPAGIENLCLQLIRHSPDGAESHLLNLDITVQTQREGFDHLVASQRLSITELPPSDGGRLLWQLLPVLRRIQPDVVLIYPFNRLTLWVAFAARLAGVSRIFTSMGNLAPEDGPGRLGFQRLMLWSARLGLRVVPCSEAAVCSVEPLPPGLLMEAVIPNGCDVAAIRKRAAAARAARPPGDPQRVLMVARFDTMKDQPTLLRAFAASGLARLGWQLWLVGDGPQRPACEALARELGLDPADIFMGVRNDIPELMGQVDLFALSTSSTEGFGIVLIEAMAAGLPVIASDVPACREVLLGGQAGELLPAGNGPAWVSRLKDLMSSDSDRIVLATQARSHVSLYDIVATANLWYNLLAKDCVR
ncbi:glycosyltransferase [Synechococcus sp. J7-Johnson]|uniref:glycosyltransferase n=1 Tax=Synechococcus sp. J7-Johnson TaxID=2823737 RepID=UPI0020CD403C|nr:glycosyltransferase [Synechococcus sp. J7-Johnson]